MSSASAAIEISTDPDRLDRELVHGFLSRESYWALGIARATFAWIADVFVIGSARGRGLGRRLVEAVLAHPEVRGARNVLLATADAHGLYKHYGFRPLEDPRRYLSLRRTAPERFSPTLGPPRREA
jgi:GNAT superfamily N-acetyltransferase